MGKQFIYALLILTQSMVGIGQGFNKSIESNSDLIGAQNIEFIAADSFLMIGVGIQNFKLNIQSFLLNSKGDTLYSKKYQNPNYQITAGWANSATKTRDGGFIFGGSYIDSSDFGYLVRFNKYGDTLWSQKYGDTINFHAIRQARELNNYDLISVGDNFIGGWLLRTDSAGTKIWERNYNSHGDIETLISVYPTPDGGFILGGERRHSASPFPNNFDPYIIKVGATGYKQWAYIYDTPNSDAPAHVIQTLDGNYVFSTSNTTKNTRTREQKAALVKVSANGTLLWAKEYGPYSVNHSFQVVKELSDSSLIAVGRRKDSTTIKGLMLKTDKDGNEIFMETFENDTNGASSANLLWDVIPLPDGGFMACGEVVALPPEVPFRQDAWVIRVDSMGCIMSNCTVGIKKQKKSKIELNIYPNPTPGNIKLSTKEKFEAIEIYNAQGQLIEKLNGSQTNIQLPVYKGIYVLRFILEKGVIVNRKVIRID